MLVVIILTLNLPTLRQKCNAPLLSYVQVFFYENMEKMSAITGLMLNIHTYNSTSAFKICSILYCIYAVYWKRCEG